LAAGAFAIPFLQLPFERRVVRWWHMNKYLAGAVLTVGLFASPLFASAAGLTSSQVQAILGLLASFGADSATIANVTTALNGGTPSTTGQSWCHTFNKDMTVGSNGDDVAALNQALQSANIDTTGNTSSFDENNAGDVVSFQAHYGIRQTGYVGPMTRAKLNALYGCHGNVMPVMPPTAVNTPASALPGATNPNMEGGSGLCPDGQRWDGPISTGRCVTTPSVISPVPGMQAVSLYKVNDARNGCKATTLITNLHIVNGMYQYQPGEYQSQTDCLNSLSASINAVSSVVVTAPATGQSLISGQKYNIAWSGYAPVNATFSIGLGDAAGKGAAFVTGLPLSTYCGQKDSGQYNCSYSWTASPMGNENTNLQINIWIDNGTFPNPQGTSGTFSVSTKG